MDRLFLAALTFEVLFNFSYLMTNNPHKPVFKTDVHLLNGPTGGRVSPIRRMVFDLSGLQQMKLRNKSSHLSSTLTPDQKKPESSAKICWSAKAEQCQITSPSLDLKGNNMKKPEPEAVVWLESSRPPRPQSERNLRTLTTIQMFERHKFKAPLF